MKTFKTFYFFLWRYKGYFIVSLFTGLISTILGNFMPFIYGYIVDNFYNFTFSTFLWVAGVYGATRIGMIAFGNLSGFFRKQVFEPGASRFKSGGFQSFAES